MRVVFLSPSLGVGGSERLTLRYAAALHSRGHRTAIAHGVQRGVTNDLAAAADAGVEVMQVSDGPLEARTLPGWASGLHRATRGFDPEVFHAQSVTSALAARLARPRRPLVMTLHGLVRPRTERVAAPVLAALRATLTAVSEPTAQSVRRHWPHPSLEVLPVGIDIEELQHAAGLERVPRTGRPAFCCVARQEPIKGIDVLLQAFALVLADLPDAGLTLVGSGSAFEDNQALARRLGVDSSSRFVGSVLQAEPWLAQSDVALLPSRREGLPVAALEALGLGRPLVASAVGGTPKVVRDGETGWLVPPEDPRALADAMIAAGRDPAEARRRGDAGRALLQREYPARAVYDQLESVLLRATAARDRGARWPS